MPVGPEDVKLHQTGGRSPRVMPLAASDGKPLSVGFVGCGMMGGSMIDGLIGSGTCAASDVITSDIVPERLAELASKRPGLHTSASNAAVACCDVVVIAVEPKDCESVCAELTGASTRKEASIYVSLAAGVKLASLAKWLYASCPRSGSCRPTPGRRIILTPASPHAAGPAERASCASCPTRLVRWARWQLAMR